MFLLLKIVGGLVIAAVIAVVLAVAWFIRIVRELDFLAT
jgi:hypothetical protein